MYSNQRLVSNLFRFVVLCVLAVTCVCCSSFQSKPSIDIERTVAFDPPHPERWTLDNGLTVMFLENRELPTVEGSLFIKGGSWNSLDLKPGSVSAMGSQMRNGGTKKLSPDALDLELELLSASIGSSFGDEYGSVSFFSLRDDVARVFDLFSQVVRRPRFDLTQFGIWKGQTLEGIKRRTDSPETIASIAFKQLVYGKAGPYGDVLTSSEVKQLTKLDLLKAHRRLVRPNEAILAVSGDIDRARLEKLVRKFFSNWGQRTTSLPEAPAIAHQARPGIYFLEFPFSQSTIAAGHIGVPRLTEDFAEITVFNEIFGTGSFTSRLTQEIRVKAGLAYGAYGAIEPALVKGRNYFFIQTKAATTAEAIERGVGVLKGLKQSEVSSAELDDTRSSVLNSFIFRFDSIPKLLNRRAYIKLLDYPEDYDELYKQGVRNTTADDVMTVAKGRWDLDSFVYVVVGNEQARASLETAVADPESELHGLEIKTLNLREELVLY